MQQSHKAHRKCTFKHKGFTCVISLRTTLQLQRASRSYAKSGSKTLKKTLRFPLFLVPEGLQVGPQLRAKLEVVLGGVLERCWEVFGRFLEAKMTPRRSKTAPRRPKMALRRAKMAPRGPKMAPRRLKMVSRRHKMALRWAKYVPRRSWRALGLIFTGFWETKMRPRRPRGAPRRPEMAPRRAR